MLSTKITTHEVTETVLPNGYIHLKLGEEIVYDVRGDDKSSLIFVNGKHIKFIYDENCGWAYQLRKTFIRSIYPMNKFFEKFILDPFWKYGFTIDFCEKVVKFGK